MKKKVKTATESLSKGFSTIGKTVTLADLVLAVFIYQLAYTKFDISPFHKINTYFEGVKKNPVVTKVHEPFNEFLAMFSQQ